MKAITTVNGEYIEQLLVDGYLIENRHPVYPLRILNYSRKTQFEKLWDETTLLCRGLIIDEDYNIVARGFSKFFNYEEHKPEEIPNLSFEVFEKMDGSLGIAFRYNNEWIIATRGSFESEQAIRAKKIWNKHFQNKDLSPLAGTLLFEILYKENRIVVDYHGEEKLVLLAVINNETGEESLYDNWAEFYQTCFGFEVVKKYEGISDINYLRSLNEENREGFILKFSNGMRVKIKFADYVRLHSIVTNISTKDIWRYIRDGKNIDELLDRVPDEFDEWVKVQRDELFNKFLMISNEAINQFREIVCSLPDNYTKKDFALKALQYKNSALIFKINEGKPFDNIIWKMIEPEWSKPWRINADDVV
jgi:RNA ligase